MGFSFKRLVREAEYGLSSVATATFHGLSSAFSATVHVMEMTAKPVNEHALKPVGKAIGKKGKHL